MLTPLAGNRFWMFAFVVISFGLLSFQMRSTAAGIDEPSREYELAKVHYGRGDAGIGGGAYDTGFTILTLNSDDPNATRVAVTAAHGRDGDQQMRVVAEDATGKQYSPSDESMVSGTGRIVGVTTAICTFDLPEKSIAKLVVIRRSPK
jgi:hypothetical protein